MMGGAGSSQPIVIQTAPIQAQIAQPAQVYSAIASLELPWISFLKTSYCIFPKSCWEWQNNFSDWSDHSTARRPAGRFSASHPLKGKAITVKVNFYVFIWGKSRKLVLYDSGVHPAAGLTPPSSFQLFHRRRIECTNIENNKQKIEKRIFFRPRWCFHFDEGDIRINPRRHYKGSRKCWK